MTEHELRYRAGVQGFASVGIPDNSQPHWYCSCSAWRKNRDLRGRPFEEAATRHHRKHVREVEE